MKVSVVATISLETWGLLLFPAQQLLPMVNSERRPAPHYGPAGPPGICNVEILIKGEEEELESE